MWTGRISYRVLPRVLGYYISRLHEVGNANSNRTCKHCLHQQGVGHTCSKKKEPITIGDYRSISVINTSIKIITKVLANRLQPMLHTLISNKQTAFIKGRSIMESFMVAREFLSSCSKRKIPSIFFKVDFEKAFDSVSWCFLTNLLIERDFPPRWVSVVLLILKSSSSAIQVNENLTNFFQHRRGPR